MISKRKRYLFIGLFFVLLTILAGLPILRGNFDKSNAIYSLICALGAILFLKNAFSRQ